MFFQTWDIAGLLGHALKKHNMTAGYAHADLGVLLEAVDTLVATGTKSGTGPVVEFPKSEAV